MDISNWNYFYKIDPSMGVRCETNLLYTPIVNTSQDIMCMHWDINSPYQTENRRLTVELMDFFFEREIKYLEIFKNYTWAPKIYNIDRDNKKIFIEWNNETCNDIIYDNSRDINIEYPDWKEQLFVILNDIVKDGYYKMALYPHCFFFDKNKKLKAFDFYSTLHHSERFIEKKKIAGMLGPESSLRFDEATTDGIIDFEIFFKRTLMVHLKWPSDPLPEFYKRIFNE